eukprot:NODE_312_length_10013_cov_0.697801.p7 type:complete len:116 gc:universal NODE_312_length_10013_cov_0.697801:8289-8636(+)
MMFLFIFATIALQTTTISKIYYENRVKKIIKTAGNCVYQQSLKLECKDNQFNCMFTALTNCGIAAKAFTKPAKTIIENCTDKKDKCDEKSKKDSINCSIVQKYKCFIQFRNLDVF